jgi:hypothetical protein
MRIVLYLRACDASSRQLKKETKKGRACAAFSLRRQARPASSQMILDFAAHAKSFAQRF